MAKRPANKRGLTEKPKQKRRVRPPLGPPQYKVLEKKYGIKESEYKRLLRQQMGLCFICHRDPRLFTTRRYRHNLCVDHCHTTGEIRGLLCKHCNSMISRWLHDDTDKIRRVLEYFERPNPKVTYHKISSKVEQDD